MTAVDIAWVAGLLEGEGCFGNYPTGRSLHRYLRIQLTISDKDVAERFAMLTGTSLHGPYHGVTNSHKDRYVVSLPNQVAAQWMMTLYPLMGIRRKAKIRECLAAWKAQPGRKKGRPKPQ